MNIPISQENERFIEDAVKSGAYTDPREIMEEALNLLRKREALRRDVNAGIDQLDQGKTVPADDVFDRLLRRIEDKTPPGSSTN
jgi:putative addiction module CopG family antidote